MKRLFHPAALLAALLLSGCGSVSLATLDEPVRRPPAEQAAPDSEGWITASTPEPSRSLAESLEDEIQAWLGTPYRYGGEDRNGVDCSAFVQQVFADALGVTLPRTTADQKHEGARVTRGALEVADLVFFHTPKRTDHVGIYLGDGRFAHASSSRGVMVSNLSERYWDDAFVFARRTHTLSLQPLEPLAEQAVPVLETGANPRRTTPATSRRRTGW